MRSLLLASRLPLLWLSLAFLAPCPRGAVAQQAPSPDAPRMLFLDGLTRAFLDDHAGAVGRYREVLEAVPEQPTVLDALAVSYAALGQYNLAQEAADLAVRLAPTYPQFAFTAARVAEQRGDLSGAEARYRQGLAQHSQFAPMLDGLAALLERRGAYADALVLLERLPPTPEVLLKRLGLYERTGDDDAFARAFSARAALVPPDAPLLRRWRAVEARLTPAASTSHLAPHPADDPTTGFAAFASGDFDTAIRRFKAALDRDAGDVRRWAALAMAYLEAARPAEARTTLDDAALIFFDAPPLRVVALYAALLAGDVSGAAALADASAGEGPVDLDTEAALLLAEAAVRQAQGDTAAARRLLGEAQALVPVGALQHAGLAPAGGALARFLPDA